VREVVVCTEGLTGTIVSGLEEWSVDAAFSVVASVGVGSNIVFRAVLSG
jgi:hypothetical protein